MLWASSPLVSYLGYTTDSTRSLSRLLAMVRLRSSGKFWNVSSSPLKPWMKQRRSTLFVLAEGPDAGASEPRVWSLMV